jgi:hypothetical protein
LIQQRAFDRARINAVVPLFVRNAGSVHGLQARCVPLRPQAAILVFNRGTAVDSFVPRPISFAPDLHDNFHPHTLAISLQPSRKLVGQLSFNDGV